MSTNDPYRRLLHHLHRTALLNERLADRELTASIGVGRTQYLVLRTIDEVPEVAVTQQRLADHLGLTKAAVSRHVLTATRQGWLATSSARSRREHQVALTTAGRDLVTRGRVVQDTAERRAVQRLGQAQLEQCGDTLAELSAMLDQRLRS